MLACLLAWSLIHSSGRLARLPDIVYYSTGAHNFIHSSRELKCSFMKVVIVAVSRMQQPFLKP